MRNTAAASFLRSISNSSARPSSSSLEQQQQQQDNNNNNNNGVNNNNNSNSISNSNSKNITTDSTNEAQVLSVDIPQRSSDDGNVIVLDESASANTEETSWKQTQAKSFLSNLSSTPSKPERTKRFTAASPSNNTSKRTSPPLGHRNNQKHQYQQNNAPQPFALPTVVSAPASVSNVSDVSGGSSGAAQSEESAEAGEESDCSGIRRFESSVYSESRNAESSSFKYVKNASALQSSDSAPNKRVFWTQQNSFPFSISTLFSFEKKKNVIESAVENGQYLIDYIEGKIVGNDDEGETEESLQDLLEPTSDPYDPHFLDDPEIRGVTRRKVMNLPCMLSTIIPYTNRKEYKKNLNAQFKQKHPDLPTPITLSKIRNLKKATLGLALGPHEIVHISTIALAHVYFERLTLKQVVTKPNRKVLMATCVLLATKFFESTVKLSLLFDTVEDVLGVSKKKALQHEFVVFKALDFSLRVEPRHIYTHITRLLQYHNISPREYFSEGQYEILHALSKIGPNDNSDQLSSS